LRERGRACAQASGPDTVAAVRPAGFVCALTLLGVVAVPGWSRAQGGTRCPTAAGLGDGPAAISGETRLAWIDARLAHTARSARRWTWGWGLGIGVATVANLAPLPFVARADRVDWYTGAATTAVGVVPLLIAPLDVIADSRALHTRVSDAATLSASARADPAVAGETSSDVCVLVADAESLLLRDAKNQSDGQRWWLHAGNVVLNVGVGLFLGLGFHHWGAGALNAVSGSIIGEAIILTQPTGTIEDLSRYRLGALQF
jgi:hypothetical protein